MESWIGSSGITCTGNTDNRYHNRASWINVNNWPTRCDYIQFYYISANCSTCFGWYLHPSSGAHVNCNYSIRPLPDAVITIYMCSWWWVKVSPETCRAFCRNIIKLYIVASCWTIIDIDNKTVLNMESWIWLSGSNILETETTYSIHQEMVKKTLYSQITLQHIAVAAIPIIR